MSDPQNIRTDSFVALDAECYGVDFNEKYIVVPNQVPFPMVIPADISLYSLSTLEFVRKLEGVARYSGSQLTWHLLGDFIIVGGDDKKIR
jgi:hypothetical protein